MMISQGLPDEHIKQLALDNRKIKDTIKDKSIKKIIVVKGKLVNIVL